MGVGGGGGGPVTGGGVVRRWGRRLGRGWPAGQRAVPEEWPMEEEQEAVGKSDS
jgi:hypothetical protein